MPTMGELARDDEYTVLDPQAYEPPPTRVVVRPLAPGVQGPPQEYQPERYTVSPPGYVPSFGERDEYGELAGQPMIELGSVLGGAAMTGGMPLAAKGTLGMAGGRIKAGAGFDPRGKTPGLGHNNPPPDVGLPANWRDLPDPNAPFPQYATEYPPVGPPIPKLKDNPKFEGEMYDAKLATPEARAFEKARDKIMADMKKNGYPLYFDVEKRFDVNPKNYPLNVDTRTVMPKTLDKMAEHLSKVGAEETRARLQAAYAKGVELGGPGPRLTTQDWYMMGQLEAELVGRMGAKAGREAFREKFAAPMAMTTGGMNPQANLIAAGYHNFLQSRGQQWPVANQWPSPVGARYGEQVGNIAQRIADEGGFKALGLDNPKRHNFAGDFMGHRNLGTMDEQMTKLMQGKGIPDWYGVNERVAAQEAAKVGVDPRKFQETVWHGFKGVSGPPMISTVNDTIERIHRLTGMPRSEIVYRVWGKGDIPVYGTAGAGIVGGMMGEAARQDQY